MATATQESAGAKFAAKARAGKGKAGRANEDNQPDVQTQVDVNCGVFS